MTNKKRWIWIGILVILLLVGLGRLVFMQQERQNRQAVSVVDDKTGDNDENYRTLIYEGLTYTYNPQITTILCAGVDSEDGLVTNNRYSIAPRADAVELVVFDNYHKKISVLAISRDTITQVGRYTMNGNFRGVYDTQLGYAYSYGDGGKVSCENLLDSVSGILGGIPIHEYVITNCGSIKRINDLVGGVTVTVPNDDLVEMYPELVSGRRVKLDHSNVEDFVRWRDVNISFSNNGRMERQQAFSTEFLSLFLEQVQDQPETVWDEIDSMKDGIQTSITKNQYLNLISYLSENRFSETDYYYLSGKDVVGDDHDEVYLNEEGKLKTILNLFYLKDGDESNE